MKNLNLIVREVDRYIFLQLCEGLKTIDTRAATSKYKSVQVGDTLTFICGADKLTKVVTKVERFDSLQEMYNHIPIRKVLPIARSLDEAEMIHYSFPGYKDKIQTNGIIAFSLNP